MRLNGKTIGLILLLTIGSIKLFSQAKEHVNKSTSPYFEVLSSNPAIDHLPLKNTSAKVNIVGVIADVTITQHYKNQGENPLEAIYTFPASSHAAVYAMEMKIGDRTIVAEIEEKEKARKEYNKAKEEGKRTSLLEQQRPNVFQMNVANIMPGDDIQVILKYTEMLVPEKGVYQFVYPTVVGPRYTGESNTSADTFTNTPYQGERKGPHYNFDIDVNVSTGVPLQDIICKTHQTIIAHNKTNEATVNLDKSEYKGGNRDFILEYRLAGDQIESGLMLYEHGDENFFMLMVQPPKRVVKEDIPPREYIFIVDVSGSMGGFPLDVTKKLLRNLVVNLRPIDRFNVMVFSGGSGWLSEESLPAVTGNIEKATQFIDRQHGGGGTNLKSAMEKALSFPRCEEGLSRSFVVVTDGYISVEKEVFDLIRKKSDQANTFAFGIGSSINHYLIEGMANVGMGEPLVVLNESDAQAKAEKFREYISTPVLSNVKKFFNGFDAYDVEPVSIPDVLAERPVIIHGKYRGNPKGTITIKGFTGRKKYKKTFDVSSVKPNKSHAAIRYLWARKKIKLLDDYTKATYGSDFQKEVTELGLKYNLMTAYTSFLAIEKDPIRSEEDLTTVKQALPLPQGVQNSAVGFEMGIDEGETVFSFHEEIILKAEFNVDTRQKLIKAIETDMIVELNELFSTNTSILSAIMVKVDKEGRVSQVVVKGHYVSEAMKKDIERIVKRHAFTKYQLNQDWGFEITF